MGDAVSKKPMPVGRLPPDFQLLVKNLTSAEKTAQVGTKLAISITRHRRKFGVGPTFAELFDPIMHEAKLDKLDVDRMKVDRLVSYSFRHHLAVHFRRTGWIWWNYSPRSLRTGYSFSRAAKAHRASGAQST